MKVNTIETMDYNEYTTIINIRATRVERREDGTWDVFIPSRPLSPEEQRMFNRLFPHTQDQAHLLLIKETLIGAIVTDVE